MNEDPSENFLARWSRRKRQIQTGGGTAGEDAASLAKANAGIAVDLENAQPDARHSGKFTGESGRAGDAPSADGEDGQATSESAPGRDFSDVDFDKLDFESDYTTFMEKDVPDDVRNLALRKLWASNPVLTFMDGLDDYCEDYTDAAVCMPAGTMKTAYKFGRGFLNDEEVAEWEALGRPEDPASDEEPLASDDLQTAIDAQPEVDGQPEAETVMANADDGEVTASYDATTIGAEADAGHSKQVEPLSTAGAKDQPPAAETA